MYINLTGGNPYIQLRFLDKNNVQTDYCTWHLGCTFNSPDWQRVFNSELEEKLFIMQELEIMGFDRRSAVFTTGLKTTFHGVSFQWVRVSEHDANHIEVLVRDI